MKRLLLVMGMVGCGGPVAELEQLGAKIERNDKNEVVEQWLRAFKAYLESLGIGTDQWYVLTHDEAFF